MKWTHLSLYLVGATITLTPVGLRMLTWPTAQEQPLNTATVEEGRKLFLHEFKANDPLCKDGDGVGPVFNANSCVACHGQGGVGGSGRLDQNVVTFILQPSDARQPPRQGMIHLKATSPKYKETFASVDPQLPELARTLMEGSGRRQGAQGKTREPLNFVGRVGDGTVQVSERNAPALFGARLIDQLPDRVIIAAERSQRLRRGLATAESEDTPVGRALRLADGRIGKFGWKAQTASLAEFVQGACANELGLGNPGSPQPKPLGQPSYQPPGLDLTLDQCNQMTMFIASLNRPQERRGHDALAEERAVEGKRLFMKIGCAECHTPNLGSIEGIYSDLLLHRMGADLQSASAYYEPPPDNNRPGSPGDVARPDEWRTPPLWGIADSGPYLHDGRAATLEDAVLQHGGQAQRSAQRFQSLSPGDQSRVIDFLKTLRAPAAN
jgi:CxxC motif-containing protein (DUF1111 family)